MGPRVSSWSLSPVVRYSKMKITAGTREELSPAQIKDRDHIFLILFFFLIYFIYLFMAVLGLRFCARAFSSFSKWGPLFIAVHRPLIISASLVAEHRLQTCRLSSCGSRA